jgi:UDP-GlcNAc:undecaprenyl-phosphate GlcNAc-1-phosphate transferase
MRYVACSFFSFIIAILLTLFIRKIGYKLKILDFPDESRKKHSKPTPLLGGLALWLSFWLVTGYIALFTNLFSKSISHSQLFGIFLGSLILIILGILDDKYSLSPKIRLLLTVIAAGIVVAMGVGLDQITNPLGGVLNLNQRLFESKILDTIFVFGDIVVFFWLIGMMYTTKILDGLDGLATGITTIGALMIFFLTQTTKFYQPEVGLLALVFAGCCLGFLVFNFNPARIFLGESGSLFLGFVLGILAVISGGKIATALLVMAVPILDLARVLIVRFISGKKISEGDREHLHFRLLDRGLSVRKTVLLMYAISFLFGMTTLILPSGIKLIALIILMLGMVGVGIWLNKEKKVKPYSTF